MDKEPVIQDEDESQQPARFSGQTTDPTPEEIAHACAEIRATWSEDEKLLRASGKDRHEPVVDKNRRLTPGPNKGERVERDPD